MEHRQNNDSPSHGPTRLMGLDVGRKRIGISLSDQLGLTAQPHGTLERKGLRRDLQEIVNLVKEYEVSEIVVGMPVNMSGTLGPQARWVAAFIRELQEVVAVPVSSWDERLTTVAAQRLLTEADMTRTKRKKNVDKLAAALILQSYLDEAC